MPEPTPLRAGIAAAWPDPPDDAIYHGLAGDIVRALDPHTEADPVGLLGTFLACVGNALGTGPHYRVGGARHELRLFPVLVGATSSGRKGTAIDTLAPLFEAALPAWWARRSKGLVSGEGLIASVGDAPEGEGADPPDKRRLVIEKEFGSIMKVMGREGNTLSTVIRDAWDGGPMETMAKRAPVRATGAHITILGHITPEELLADLTATDAQNGFANRFLWLCVRRSKLLPFGGDLGDNELLAMADVLRAAVKDGRGLGRLGLTDAAREAWVGVYESLTTGEPGLVGTLLGRGAPYAMRIAATYAALDAAPAIDRPHLRAALALWGYADASVRHIFGATARPAANEAYRRTILAALVGGRLSQTEISNDIFGGNLRPPEPHASLDALLGAGLIARTFERPASGRGRNITFWELTDAGRAGVAG